MTKLDELLAQRAEIDKQIAKIDGVRINLNAVLGKVNASATDALKLLIVDCNKTGASPFTSLTQMHDALKFLYDLDFNSRNEVIKYLQENPEVVFSSELFSRSRNGTNK